MITGIDLDQLRELVVRPALHEIGLHSDAAEDLVVGTGIQESRLRYLKQLGRGPALGIFQVEPATYDDYLRWLMMRTDLDDAICNACHFVNIPNDPHAVVWNLKFAAICCRIHYRRVREPLPWHGDLLGYARYWKKYYNTVHGAGTEEEFIDNYNEAHDDEDDLPTTATG